MNGVIRTAVCTLLHDGRGKYLVYWRTSASRDEHERWDIGGGGVKFGEKIEDALVREIKEEFCATVLSYEFMGWRDVFRVQEGKDTHWIVFDFKILVDPATVAIGEPEKTRELRWVTHDELMTLDPAHSQLSTHLEKNRAFLI
jgi:ADP-ribose pyrophosphatase YjhB (NUDIX family)